MNQLPSNQWLSDQFLNYLSDQKQYSPHTIANYKRDIQLFFDAPMIDQRAMATLDRHSIKTYVQWVARQDYHPRSIARFISSLRSFWTYLVDQQHIDQNPWLQMDIPKQPKRLPYVISEDEMMYYLDSIDTTTWLGVRDRCLCEMLYGTGIRISECVNINVMDINIDDQSIRIVGKGNKERIVLFHPEAHRWLRLYLEQRPYSNDALFLNRSGSRITQRSVQRMIQKHAQNVGLNQVTPHTFRHSFATDMYNRGADLRLLQELLGHEQLSTTQLYTHVSTQRLQKIHQQSHPLNQ